MLFKKLKLLPFSNLTALLDVVSKNSRCGEGITMFSPVQVKTVVFDKTGTLTHGKPTVTKAMLFVADTVCPNHLFAAIVGLAESSSEHPLGAAVVNFAKEVRLKHFSTPIFCPQVRNACDYYCDVCGRK